MREINEVEVAEVAGGTESTATEFIQKCADVGIGLAVAYEASETGQLWAAWAGIIQAANGTYACVKDAAGYIHDAVEIASPYSCTSLGNGYAECTFTNPLDGSTGPMLVPEAPVLQGTYDSSPTAFESMDMTDDFQNYNYNDWESDVGMMGYDSMYASCWYGAGNGGWSG